MRATSPSTPSSTEANCATSPPVVAWPIAKESPAASVAPNEASEICQGETLRESRRSVMRRESGRFRCRAIRPSETPTAAASTLRRARATSSGCATGSLRTACHSSATLRVATGSRRATSDSAFSSEHASGGASSSARAKEAVTRARPDAARRRARAGRGRPGSRLRPGRRRAPRASRPRAARRPARRARRAGSPRPPRSRRAPSVSSAKRASRRRSNQ